MEDLPPPEEIMAQYKEEEIDLEMLAIQTLRHVIILNAIKEIEQIVLNGLLEDVQMITDALKLKRPSAPSRERLKAWLQKMQIDE